MFKKQPKTSRRFFTLFPLMLLAGIALNASAEPLPLPSGRLDTNLFNTNGLVLPSNVRFLLHDLQTNINQLQSFLTIINGEQQTNSVTNKTRETNTQPPASAGTHALPDQQTSNGIPLVYGLGAALENVQTDLQELLPRLAAMVGHSNYSGSLSTNHPAVPNRFEQTNAPPKIQPTRTSTEQQPRSFNPIGAEMERGWEFGERTPLACRVRRPTEHIPAPGRRPALQTFMFVASCVLPISEPSTLSLR